MTDQKKAADAVIERAAQNIYRNSVKYWFLRYGYLKAIDGIVTEYPRTKLLHVQDLIFTHHDECLAAKKPCLQITLKPRKGGASTGHQACMYFRGRRFSGREGAIMGDIAGTSDTVFEIYRRFAENDKFDWGDGLPNLLPGDKERNLTDDIILPNGSTYKKVTAGSSNANRSGTIQFANGTEVAYYPNNLERDPLTSFLGSWHDSGEASYACLDSTSNGPQGKFYDYYMDERNGWKKIFSAWFQEPTYRIPFRSIDDENKFKRDLSLEKEDMDTMQRFNLDLEQMQWLRDKLLNKCGGSRDKLNKEYPNTVEEAFLSKSALRFNIHVLENMERAAKVNPPKKGDFVTQEDGSASFLPDPQGDVKIFEEPQFNRKYIGAFDPCAGEDQQAKGQSANPDWHSIQILRDAFVDIRNGTHYPPKIVAHYRSRADVSIACEAAAAMSRYYGKCQFIVETNGVGLYPVKRLAELEIPLWMRKVKGKTQGTMDTQAGWNSNATNRTTIIDALGGYIQKWRPEEPTFECFDLDIIEELKKVVTADGTDKAMPGFHDDTCFVAGTLILTPKGQTPIESLRVGDEVLTREGPKKIAKTFCKKSSVISNLGLVGTPEHPVITPNGEIQLVMLNDNDTIYVWNQSKQKPEKLSFTQAKNTIDTLCRSGDSLGSIFGDMISGRVHPLRFIDKCGLIISEQSQKGLLFITKMTTRLITRLEILKSKLSLSTPKITQQTPESSRSTESPASDKESVRQKPFASGGKKTPSWRQILLREMLRTFVFQNPKRFFVFLVISLLRLCLGVLSFVQKSARFGQATAALTKKRSVYNIQVEGSPEYFANGILVHNCMALAMILYLKGNATMFFEPRPKHLDYAKVLKSQGWTLRGSYQAQE